VYCDFATEAMPSQEPAIDRYIEKLIAEIRAASRDGLLRQIETIYIGGGTPTHIGAMRLTTLIQTLAQSLDLQQVLEFTLEANPESTTSALVHEMCTLGVNRFSLGVQSLNDGELRLLGRAHNAQQAYEAMQAMLQHCDNVSIDLMCGIPGQDEASWRKTLIGALEQRITHLSIYPLSIEEETPLAVMLTSGAIVGLPDEDVQAEMLLIAEKHLNTAGFERYKVASYARDKSYQSRHNKAYWTG